MRGLWKAALLCLTAVVASASPEPGLNAIRSTVLVVDPTISVEEVSPGAIAPKQLSFRLDVSGFHAACDYAHITVNNKNLTQDVPANGESTTEFGLLSLYDQRIVEASWSFRCIKSNGAPDHILMNFDIHSVDGKPIEQSGFELAFSQTNHATFLYTNVKNGNYIPSRAASEFSLEDELVELQWMNAQLQELKVLIAEKERTLLEHGVQNVHGHIKDCDDLACVAQVAFSKASDTAHKVIGKITGHQGKYGEDFGNEGPHHGTGDHMHLHPPHWPPFHRSLPSYRYPFSHHPHHNPHDGKPPGYEGSGNPNHCDHPPPPRYGDNFYPNRGHLFKYLIIVNFAVITIPLIIYVASVFRWFCCCRTRRSKEERRARREARRERCTRHRAAFRAALSTPFSRLISRCSQRSSEEVDEEKQAALLSDAEDGISTAMTDEIAQFQSVVSIVDDIVHAEQARTLSRIPLTMPPPEPERQQPIPIPINERRCNHSIEEVRSELGDEELPAYASYDERHVICNAPSTEISESVISDGFRYSPGSSEYASSYAYSSSETSSIIDIDGPDTKQ
ncbi:hypothetical protein B7463_g11711, partial [Scytalidium lignicola]